MSAFSFDGRTALISGGAGDIGSAIAQELVKRGMRVMIADMNPISTAHICEKLGHLAVPFVGDLSEETSVTAALEKVETAFGHLDLLIPNASIVNTERFHTRSVASIEHELKNNLIGPLMLMRLAIPLLQKSDDPRIVVTTSLGGIQPLRETSIYAASKFGLRGACLSIALDEELHGIKIATVAPTATDTQQLREEAVSDGNILNYIDTPQQPQAVAATFIRALQNHKLETYPKKSDALLSRFAMLFPNLQPKMLGFFERKGRKGHARYIKALKSRGLVEEAEGTLRLTKRPGRDIPVDK